MDKQRTRRTYRSQNINRAIASYDEKDKKIKKAADWHVFDSSSTSKKPYASERKRVLSSLQEFLFPGGRFGGRMLFN